MTLEELQETDPRFERRKVLFVLSEGDIKAFIAEREKEGWDLYFQHTLFDYDGKPVAMEMRFRRKLEAKANSDLEAQSI